MESLKEYPIDYRGSDILTVQMYGRVEPFILDVVCVLGLSKSQEPYGVDGLNGS